MLNVYDANIYQQNSYRQDIISTINSITETYMPIINK